MTHFINPICLTPITDFYSESKIVFSFFALIWCIFKSTVLVCIEFGVYKSSQFQIKKQKLLYSMSSFLIYKNSSQFCSLDTVEAVCMSSFCFKKRKYIFFFLDQHAT